MKKMTILTKSEQLSPRIPIKPSISGLITLPRLTKGGIPNINGYTYTEEAFDNAMKNYIMKSGIVCLAPEILGIDGIDDKLTVKEIAKFNDAVYTQFHSKGANDKYLFGNVEDWNENTITFKYIKSDIGEKYLPLIYTDTKINMRYMVDTPSIKKEITSMGIILFDITVIPFDDIRDDYDEDICKLYDKFRERSKV